jgi:hypothetical protein
MFREKSDCDIIFENAENMFNDLGNCFDTAFDKRKSKMNVVGSIFNLGKSLTKLTLNTGVCAVKNAPKAVIAVASLKREVVIAIEEEIHEHKKQVKIDTLNEKIKQLGLKA